MLRKRTRSVQKDQHQMGHNHNHNQNQNQNQQQVSDSGSESSFHSDGVNNKNPKNNSSFYTTIPGLLVGLTPKGLALADCCDSVRSPTSPLDFKLFPGLGNPFIRSSSSSSTTARSDQNHHGQQRSWVGLGCGGGGGGSKLGLISIIDSHNDDHNHGHDHDGDDDNGMKSSSPSKISSKNILFGPKLRVLKNPFGSSSSSSSSKSLPKNYAVFPHSYTSSSKPKSPLQKGSSDVLFEIGESSSSSEEEPPNPHPHSDSFGKLRSCSLDSCRTISIGSQAVGSLSATEIELSEDYTCVISHGPNPKTTHIFGDCILETHSNTRELRLSNPTTTTTTTTNSEVSFLSFCYSCNKKLEDGKDIYIYRGEKAFCSMNCRSLEMLIDVELEKSSDKDPEDNPDDDVDYDDCKELFFETQA